MSQGALPFKYKEQLPGGGMTALAGLPVYLDLAHVMGLSRSVEKHLEVRANGRGWSDSQVITSLVLLNLAGGDCVDELDIFETDEGTISLKRIANRFSVPLPQGPLSARSPLQKG